MLKWLISSFVLITRHRTTGHFFHRGPFNIFFLFTRNFERLSVVISVRLRWFRMNGTPICANSVRCRANEALSKSGLFLKVNSQLTLLRGKTTELFYGISWLQSPSGTHDVFSDFFSHAYSIIRVFYPSIRIVWSPVTSKRSRLK